MLGYSRYPMRDTYFRASSKGKVLHPFPWLFTYGGLDKKIAHLRQSIELIICLAIPLIDFPQPRSWYITGFGYTERERLK